MSKLTFVEFNGTEHAVEIDAGLSLMQLAVDNCVPGIDADCGGSCACGTCHVILESSWSAASGEPSEDETQMLDLTPEREASSRLACQITVSDEMDGMVVRLPEFQM